jgi:hypothetical protein
VAVAVSVPGAELLDLRRRSGIGRLTGRRDIAALAVLFAFGALMNAFGMTAPVYDLERWLGRVMGSASEAPVLAVIFVIMLGAVPLALIGGAASVTRYLTQPSSYSVGQVAMRYVWVLIPFGFGVWLAHYGFHLLTGGLTLVPVTQSAVIDVAGWAALGDPRWQWTGIRPGVVFPIQLGFILLGTFGSLALSYLISERDYPQRPVLAAVPWAALAVALATAAVWILFQPMEMRGIGLSG